MPANQKHVHLAWLLWLDLRVIPTHGEFRALTNIVSSPGKKTPVAAPGHQVPPAATAAHAAWDKGQNEVDLKAMFSKQAEQEFLQTVREFQACKQEEGQSVSSYVLKKKIYIDNLERLGQPISQNLAVSLILVSLNKDYDSFVQNYNMHSMGKTVNELHAMLKLHEDTLPKKDVNPALHAIRAGRTPLPPKKDNPAKDAICHQCGEIGHWRRNCLVYLAELMKKKKLSQGASTLGTWRCHRAAVEAIGTYHLELPSRLVIVLNNCYYAPSITRGVILVSRLFDDGFINRFDKNNVILVSKNNLVYFMAVPRDGIFEIDISCSNTNDSSMYTISNKRAKTNLDSSLLWNCRLGHISKKRIEKLQHDGLLNSIDIESLGNRYGYVYLLKHKHEVFETFKGCEALIKRDTLTKPEKLDPRSFKCIFIGYPKETMRYSFYNPSENKVFIARNAEFFENDLIDLKASGSVEDLELIQVEDTNPSLDTSLDHEEDDQEINEPQSDINSIRKSSRTRRAPDRMCLYIDAKEHELGDLGEPANYKVALLDPELKKWLDAMNVEMQSMKDNDV
ncbi:zinc finger, CCHC-type containing protein [Tanacetum coccineum]